MGSLPLDRKAAAARPHHDALDDARTAAGKRIGMGQRAGDDVAPAGPSSPVDVTRPRVRDRPKAAFGRVTAAFGAGQLGFRFPGHFERVLDLDAEVPDGTFKLGMAEHDLNRPYVLGSPVISEALVRRMLCVP